MASRWALARANDIEKKHGHCCGDVIELYTDSLAEALDAALEEVANSAAEIRRDCDWMSDSRFIERVLDKLGR